MSQVYKKLLVCRIKDNDQAKTAHHNFANLWTHFLTLQSANCRKIESDQTELKETQIPKVFDCYLFYLFQLVKIPSKAKKTLNLKKFKEKISFFIET